MIGQAWSLARGAAMLPCIGADFARSQSDAGCDAALDLPAMVAQSARGFLIREKFEAPLVGDLIEDRPAHERVGIAANESDKLCNAIGQKAALGGTPVDVGEGALAPNPRIGAKDAPPFWARSAPYPRAIYYHLGSQAALRHFPGL